MEHKIRIAAYIGHEAAIRAGLDTYGHVSAELPAVLALVDNDEETKIRDCVLAHPTTGALSAEVPAPTIETLRRLGTPESDPAWTIKVVLEAFRAQIRRDEAEAAELDGKARKIVAVLETLTNDGIIGRGYGAPDSDTVIHAAATSAGIGVSHTLRARILEIACDIVAALASDAAKEYDRRKSEDEARRKAKAEADAAAKAERDRVRDEYVRTVLLANHEDKSVLERWEANRLPYSEIEAIDRARILALVGIDEADDETAIPYPDCGCGPECGTTIETDQLVRWNRDVWARYKVLRDKFQASGLTFDEPEPRLVHRECDECGAVGIRVVEILVYVTTPVATYPLWFTI